MAVLGVIIAHMQILKYVRMRSEHRDCGHARAKLLFWCLRIGLIVLS